MATHVNGSVVGLANPSTNGIDHLAAPEDGLTPDEIGDRCVLVPPGRASASARPI
jgi:hypothetical protein